MSVNSSHPTNGTFKMFYFCFDANVDIFISVALTIVKSVLLVPLSILVLYLGYQQWRQQRSLTTTRHADFFTLHMAAMELISVSGWVLYCCGSFMDLPGMTAAGFYVSFILLPGQIFFHIFTCVERYLAVVHPVTYLGLRQTGGVRIRNISTWCVWLVCFGWCGVSALYVPKLPIIPFFCFMAFSLFAISFCSLSVLCVLIRPGPGEVGGDRERVDRTKRRAFRTIMVILGVLALMCVATLVSCSVQASPLLSSSDGCAIMMSAVWFSLPSNLVLPLLFLHRAGKLQCCSNAE